MEVFKKFFDEYSLKASLVPTLMFVLLINLLYLLYYQKFFSLPGPLIQISLQTVASLGLIFFLSSTIRGIGKYVVEELMYSGRINMPTTKILLNPNKSRLSMQKIEEIYRYIFDDLKIDLKERKKILEGQTLEAKKEISEVVAKIRDKTRSDDILKRYNIQYGMYRNTTGGVLLFLVLSLITIGIDKFLFDFSSSITVFAIFVTSFLLLFILIILTKKNAEDYAERLFDAFILAIDSKTE